MAAPNTNQARAQSSELSEASNSGIVKATHQRCEDVALKLYAERSVGSFRNLNAEVLILQCFKDAQAFLDISQRLQNGELSVEKQALRLSDASAPNLPATHPMNLISQRFVEKNGGTEDEVLKRITHIVDFLKANPTLGKPGDGVDLPGPDKVILEEIEVKGSDPIRVNWTVPDINTARLILPPLIKEPAKAG